MTPSSARVALRGAGGEPVDLWRTIRSHGLVALPPFVVDDEQRRLTVTISLGRGHPRALTIRAAGTRHAVVEVSGPAVGTAMLDRAIAKAKYLLRLDEDLSPFYEAAASDPDLAWAAAGAGRLLRSGSVFEEVVKTVCTTNCSWGLTTKMINALVAYLGVPAAGARHDGAAGRAFPTPPAMAAAPLAFYRDVMRAGYRGPYFKELARLVAEGEIDLESLAAPRSPLSDDEVEQTLLALPGVGPYAAAHIMMMIGRYSRLILDSWTRPTYARLVGKKSVSDATIMRRFRRYGRYAGLAFWLMLTNDWVSEANDA